ncbi:MAG: hypothetical protein K2L12_00850 [Clostridia bacterium]|nr:hypothetical protein [Clostridia bacterium]
MSAKQFFKSTTFKCLVTLLCILLICGVFLTIAYGFLEVTDEERLSRALSKIYGEKVAVDVLPTEGYENENATIVEAYKDENGDYLIKSKGKGGFGGTVTCWVLVDAEDSKISKVDKVIIETSDGETFLGDINYLDKFAETPYTEGFEYTIDNGFKTSGASKSSTAIDNAVNGAVGFVNNILKGGKA